MPIPTWRSYATKVRKKPKSDFRQYIGATSFGISREAEYCDSNEQSEKIEEEQIKKKEKINEKTIQESQEERIQSDEKTSRQSTGCSVGKQDDEKENEIMLRPPIEVYEALDNAIEKHLERVHSGKETKTRKRGSVQSSRSIGSEVGSIQSSSSSSLNRQKEIRS